MQTGNKADRLKLIKIKKILSCGLLFMLNIVQQHIKTNIILFNMLDQISQCITTASNKAPYQVNGN